MGIKRIMAITWEVVVKVEGVWLWPEVPLYHSLPARLTLNAAFSAWSRRR